MEQFNPLDYGDPVEVGSSFNPLDYGDPVEEEKTHSTIAPVPETQKSEIPVPEWAREHPNLFGAYGAGKAVLEQAVTPAVEATATIAGGVFGSPIVGSALGYGIGKKGMDIVEEAYTKLGGEEVKDKTITGELVGTAKDVGTAMALGKGFDVAGKAMMNFKPALQKTSQYLFDTLPDRLYASAVKAPLSKAWIKILPGKEVSKRTAAVKEGLKAKISPSEFGLAKVKHLEKEVRGQVDDATALLSENPNLKIKVADILEDGLKKAYGKAKLSSAPSKEKAAIDTIKEDFKEHGKYLTPENANAIKRKLYQEVSWGEAVDPTVKMSKKGIAKAIMHKLEDFHPALKELNETDAARIGLIDVIERSVARQGNKDIVSLGTKVMATHPKAWPLAIWNSTIGHPQVKARIAFALAKGNPQKYSRMIYPELPAGYTPAKEIAEKGVYRYNPKSVFTKSKTPKPLEMKLQPAHEQIPFKKLESIAKREEAKRLKELERIFKEQEGKKGPPLLRKTETQYTKSKIPKPLKTKIWPVQPLN